MLAKIKEAIREKNRYAKAWTHFEEGEVECAKCDGTGKHQESPFWWMYKCKRCDGTGKTDWVTNVMGRPGEEYESSCSSDWSSSIAQSQSSRSTTYLRRVK